MQKSLFIPLSCTFLHFLSSANISLVISIAKNELSCKKSQVIFLASNELFSWNCNIRSLHLYFSFQYNFSPSLRLWWKKCFSQLNFIVVPLLIHDLETDLLVRIKVCKLFLWGWVCPYLPYRQPPAAKSVLKDNFSIPQFVLAFPLENCCNTSYTGFPNFKFSLSLKW